MGACVSVEPGALDAGPSMAVDRSQPMWASEEQARGLSAAGKDCGHRHLCYLTLGWETVDADEVRGEAPRAGCVDPGGNRASAGAPARPRRPSSCTRLRGGPAAAHGLVRRGARPRHDAQRLPCAAPPGANKPRAPLTQPPRPQPSTATCPAPHQPRYTPAGDYWGGSSVTSGPVSTGQLLRCGGASSARSSGSFAAACGPAYKPQVGAWWTPFDARLVRRCMPRRRERPAGRSAYVRPR